MTPSEQEDKALLMLAEVARNVEAFRATIMAMLAEIKEERTLRLKKEETACQGTCNSDPSC